MNPEAQEYLEKILAKDPSWLNQDEVNFLNARRDYLTDENKRVFASVLRGSQATEPIKAELIAKILELDPTQDEKALKKMKNTDLVLLVAETEANANGQNA